MSGDRVASPFSLADDEDDALTAHVELGKYMVTECFENVPKSRKLLEARHVELEMVKVIRLGRPIVALP